MSPGRNMAGIEVEVGATRGPYIVCQKTLLLSKIRILRERAMTSNGAPLHVRPLASALSFLHFRVYKNRRRDNANLIRSLT